MSVVRCQWSVATDHGLRTTDIAILSRFDRSSKTRRRNDGSRVQPVRSSWLPHWPVASLLWRWRAAGGVVAVGVLFLVGRSFPQAAAVGVALGGSPGLVRWCRCRPPSRPVRSASTRPLLHGGVARRRVRSRCRPFARAARRRRCRSFRRVIPRSSLVPPSATVESGWYSYRGGDDPGMPAEAGGAIGAAPCSASALNLLQHLVRPPETPRGGSADCPRCRRLSIAGPAG